MKIKKLNEKLELLKEKQEILEEIEKALRDIELSKKEKDDCGNRIALNGADLIFYDNGSESNFIKCININLSAKITKLIRDDLKKILEERKVILQKEIDELEM